MAIDILPIKNLEGAGGAGEVLGDTRFPVFLRVADYAERLVKQPNTNNDYKKNLGYDYIALALVYAERFHQLADDSNLSEQISQFQTNYTLGLTHFRQL
ncbi:hypothetical protein [Coleofasciculus sp. G2-EDA-02]|uniref:hypothetical protein n=1 Tax=Coleofasciculus sp. G2-EDA-02 TaxID=3069529 RepID=UPI0032F8DF40